MRQNQAGTVLIVATFAILVGALLLLLPSRSSKTDAAKAAVNTASYKAWRVEKPTISTGAANEPHPAVRAESGSLIQPAQDSNVLATPSANLRSVGYAVAIAGDDPATTATDKPLLTPLELVWIPPGTFFMGSPDDEPGRRSNEGPQTQATINRGFWLSKYEVTRNQYQTFMGELPSRTARNDQYQNQLVRGLSWEDAMSFCRAVTEQEGAKGQLPKGYVYRLPTEAEWEYACRAGTTTPFTFGDDPHDPPLDSYAWYGPNSRGTPHPVGTKNPNPWGLYDMQGNVSEWCLDNLGRYPGGSANDPVGSLTSKFRVLKGGALNDPKGDGCRSAFRHSIWDSQDIIQAGFRIALASIVQEREPTRP